MYRYETHLHTSPVSKCARAGVQETLEFYRSLEYDGVFVTNHFLDGNINIDKARPYEEKLDFYFQDYLDAVEIGKQLGLQVFPGVELSHGGTDFLVYGLPLSFYYDHPEIMEMTKKAELAFLMEAGAFLVQAHPYREAGYIDHIRLYPRSVHAVETLNSSRIPFENEMADRYADAYGLLKTAGSDNHIASRQVHLAGMETEDRLTCAEDFIEAVRTGAARIFTLENPQEG